MNMQPRLQHILMEDPPLARALFAGTRFAWLWLVLRIYVGWEWLNAGWHKLNDPGWVNGGEALKAFWERAVQVPQSGRPPVAFDWYRSFLQFLLDTNSHTWFAWLIVVGQLAVGVALILGAFVGLAAFGGALMNWNFMMAGTASTNPVLFVIAILLMLAWKVAGYYGLDRWLLPALGTPWQPAGPISAAKPGVPNPGQGQKTLDKEA